VRSPLQLALIHLVSTALHRKMRICAEPKSAGDIELLDCRQQNNEALADNVFKIHSFSEPLRDGHNQSVIALGNLVPHPCTFSKELFFSILASCSKRSVFQVIHLQEKKFFAGSRELFVLDRAVSIDPFAVLSRSIHH